MSENMDSGGNDDAAEFVSNGVVLPGRRIHRSRRSILSLARPPSRRRTAAAAFANVIAATASAMASAQPAKAWRDRERRAVVAAEVQK